MKNILCDEVQGRANFILCDFDLAILLNEDGSPAGPGARGTHHTGTLPFMARQLVEDLALHPGRPHVPHELHHDFESLYWVALWCTMKADYEEQEPTFQERINSFLARWMLVARPEDSEDSEDWTTRSDASCSSEAQQDSMQGRCPPKRAAEGASRRRGNMMETHAFGSAFMHHKSSSRTF